ncbi:MAG: ArsR family transcriptional regulator [Conexibacter sp.]|nr:ArsR family transcriptional regulator [Conexibacter sp.]
MIRYRFGHEDLLRTRFAISPLMELSGSVEALRQPERFAIHAPWVAWAAPRIPGLEWDLLDAVIPRDARFYPDFVSPPPREPQAQLEGELRRVMETPGAQVADELRRAYPGGLPPAAEALVGDPEQELPRLVRQMRAWWDAVLAPRWDAILAMVEAEVAWRGRRLAAVGPAAAFADLHDTVVWRDGAVEVRSRTDNEVELGGRGLLLVPAAFAWPDVWPMNDPPWQPAIVYAPRGLAELWAPPSGDAAALDALLGARRASVLAALDRPVSTQELSRRLSASPAGVSAHLGVLRRAGLVAGRREGRHVLYGRTRAGDTLLGAARRGQSPSAGAGDRPPS